MERAVLLCEGGTIGEEEIRGELRQFAPAGRARQAGDPRRGLDFEALEKELLRKALEKSGGWRRRPRSCWTELQDLPLPPRKIPPRLARVGSRSRSRNSLPQQTYYDLMNGRSGRCRAAALRARALAGSGACPRRGAHAWTVFDKTHGLAENTVQAIVPDGAGGLWIGTRAG